MRKVIVAIAVAAGVSCSFSSAYAKSSDFNSINILGVQPGKSISELENSLIQKCPECISSETRDNEGYIFYEIYLSGAPSSNGFGNGRFNVSTSDFERIRLTARPDGKVYRVIYSHNRQVRVRQAKGVSRSELEVVTKNTGLSFSKSTGNDGIDRWRATDGVFNDEYKDSVGMGVEVIFYYTNDPYRKDAFQTDFKIIDFDSYNNKK